MKTISSIIILLSLAACCFAQQKETFDLATYSIPKGWKKVDGGNGVIGYAITNNLTGTYCQIAIYKSMGTMGNAQLDFDTEWNDLVVKPYNVATKPEAVPGVSEDGWEAKAGVAPFDYSGGKSIAMLVTMSGYAKRMSIVILTNTEDYQTEIEFFLGSVDLKKPETATSGQTGISQQTPPINNDDKNSILGSWVASSSDQSSWRVNNGVMSTIWRQYTFNANGTYTFITKTFDPLMDKLLLGKENGTHQISGNTITVTPQKSVLEAWSKKDGTNTWGNFLTTQNIALEKTTYRFTKHYFEGIQKWNLVLQADQVTRRDGPFNGNTTFTNAWYYGPLSANNQAIELPAGQQTSAEEIKKPEQPIVQAKANGKFAFNTTNFDDGWVGTEQEDWAQVTKGNIKVLVHYPNKAADAYNTDLMEGLKNAWNVLVAPRYSSASNFEFKPISSWQSIEFAEADMVENGTGNTVHVVLFKINYSGGGGKYLEFITADKNSFEQEFGAYHQTSSGWEKMESMATYNKFAVAPLDLSGKWSNKYSGMTQYVNAYTGASAGANTHASAQNFEFIPGNTYKWDLAVASGMVGNIKFQSVKSAGKFTMPNNWQINFSDMEGKPKTYNAYFSCIKGARVLWLQDVSYGDYSSYGKID